MALHLTVLQIIHQTYNELEAQGTGTTVSASGGSLVNLNLITENATAHTTTTTSLDGGVTLTSITEGYKIVNGQSIKL